MDILEGTLLVPRGSGDQACIIISQHEDEWTGVRYIIRNVKTRATHTIGHSYMLDMYEPTNSPTAYILFGVNESLPKGEQNE